MGDNLNQHNPNFIVLQSGIGVWLRVIWSNLCTSAQSPYSQQTFEQKKKDSWKLQFPSFTWEIETTDWLGSNSPIGPLETLLAPSEIWAASCWGNAVTVTSTLTFPCYKVLHWSFAVWLEVPYLTHMSLLQLLRSFFGHQGGLLKGYIYTCI